MHKSLQSTEYFELENERIQELIADLVNLERTEDKIEGIYLKIRDGWRYSPYRIGLTKEHYKVKNIVKQREAHCIDKAILLITGLRALGIPARLRLAKVTNHIAAEVLEQKIGTNELAPHGIVDVYHNNKWVKCSPTFNKELCQIYNVEPLHFDGTQDAILQEYNKQDQKFMSYLEDYGAFDDVPFDVILDIFKRNFPKLYKDNVGKDEFLMG